VIAAAAGALPLIAVIPTKVGTQVTIAKDRQFAEACMGPCM
jgi:hypothetical protein